MTIRNRILRKLRREKSMFTPKKLAVKLRVDSGVVSRALEKLKACGEIKVMSLEQAIHAGK